MSRPGLLCVPCYKSASRRGPAEPLVAVPAARAIAAVLQQAVRERRGRRSRALIEDLYDVLPRRLGETRLTDLIDDRRFAETIDRVALADGIMDRVTYRDPPEDAS
jgi:hypothetical protein